jgi:hypothetical protein
MNPLGWVKWLPYVLMCYRRRIHSVTGYSPFQLMFGRPMNNFSDWRVQDTEDEHVALQYRSEEFRALINIFQPAALQTIGDHHPLQQAAQNNQHRVDDTILPPGTTVYLKVEGFLNKLEPRFRGPYTIHSQDSRGNYTAKNAFGNLLNTVYPRHKIKVVAQEDDDAEHYEFEKILQHRRCKESNQYE